MKSFSDWLKESEIKGEFDGRHISIIAEKAFNFSQQQTIKRVLQILDSWTCYTGGCDGEWIDIGIEAIEEIKKEFEVKE